MPQTQTSPDSKDRQAVLIDVLATPLLDLLVSPSPQSANPANISAIKEWLRQGGLNMLNYLHYLLASPLEESVSATRNWNTHKEKAHD